MFNGHKVSVHTAADHRGNVDIALTVRLNGAVVTDLEPYLGASGHLIGIHSGDLAYAHVHPDDYEHHRSPMHAREGFLDRLCRDRLADRWWRYFKAAHRPRTHCRTAG